MKNATVNLRNLVIVVADPSSYWRRAIYGILRSFGANKVIEVEHSMDLIRILSSQKVDLLLCDTQIHPHNWLKLTQIDPAQCDQRESHRADLAYVRGHERENCEERP